MRSGKAVPIGEVFRQQKEAVPLLAMAAAEQNPPIDGETSQNRDGSTPEAVARSMFGDAHERDSMYLDSCIPIQSAWLRHSQTACLLDWLITASPFGSITTPATAFGTPAA